MDEIDKEKLIVLFSEYDLVAKHIDINDVLANVFIVISDTEQYRLDTIDNVVQKLKNMKEKLLKDDLIDDIMISNLYKGVWRILVYFKE